MSHIEVKCVKLDADSSPEVMLAEIRKHLGDELPEEALAELTNSIVEARRSADKAKKHGFDLEAEAERIAKLPKEQQVEALREATIKLGESCGLTREQALKRAAEANSKVTNLLDKLGMEVPEHYKGNIFASDGEKTDEKTEESQRSSNFDASIKKMALAGYSMETIGRIGWWHNAQDEYGAAMEQIGKAALHKHAPSVDMLKSMFDYAKNSNQYVYDVCEKSGIDPTTLGFKSRAEQAKDTAELEDALRQLLGTVE